MKPRITLPRTVTTIQTPRRTSFQKRHFAEKSPEEIQEITSTLNRLSASVQTKTVKLNEGQTTETKPGPKIRSNMVRNFETEEAEGRLSSAQLDVVLGLIERDPTKKNELAEKYGLDAMLLSTATEYIAIPEIQITERGKKFSIGPKGSTFTPPKKTTP